LLTVTTEPLENCEVLMTVQVDDQQADELLKAAAKRITRQVQIRGFRPGKAPYHLVVRRVGEEMVRAEAAEDLRESVFRQALEQASLEPFAPADMEDITWSPLVMKVRVPVEPIVELGDYRALRLPLEPVEVTPDDVEDALMRLQHQHARWNVVERPAQLGDRLDLTITERVGDRTPTDKQEIQHELLPVAENSGGPDFTAPLLGATAGEERTFAVTFPQDYEDEELAGQTAEVTATVRQVREKELFPLDDEFAQMVGDYSSLEELKQKVTDNLRQRERDRAERKLAEQALEKIVEQAPRVEWHKSLEDRLLDRALEDEDRSLKERNLNLDMYLSAQQKTREGVREELRPAARQRLRHTLVFNELAEREGLSVEGREIAEQIDSLSLLAGERSTQLRQILSSSQGLQQVANNLLNGKIRERLVQIVTGQLPAEPPAASAQAEPAAEQQPVVEGSRE